MKFKKCVEDTRSGRDISYFDGGFKKSESHSGTITHFLNHLRTVHNPDNSRLTRFQLASNSLRLLGWAGLD